MRQINSIVVLGLAATLLSSCGIATMVTDTQAMKPAGNGVHLRSGGLQLSSLVVVADSDAATLSGTIVNRGDKDDQILAIGIDGAKAVLSPASLTVPSGERLTLGFAGESAATVGIVLAPGSSTVVDVLFASGAQVSGSVMVVAPTGAYSGIDPALPVA